MKVNYNIINKENKKLENLVNYDDNPYVHLGEDFDINVTYDQAVNIVSFDCDGYLKKEYYCYDVRQLDFLLNKYKEDFVDPSKETAALVKSFEICYKNQYKDLKRKQAENIRKLKEEIKNRNKNEDLER